MLPEDAFFNRSDRGPALFLSDDAAAEISALKTVWPEATHLLCQWHCCQAVWRWLWSAQHNIAKLDRPVLMKLFTTMVYCRSMTSFKKAEEAFNEDDIAPYAICREKIVQINENHFMVESEKDPEVFYTIDMM